MALLDGKYRMPSHTTFESLDNPTFSYNLLQLTDVLVVNT